MLSKIMSFIKQLHRYAAPPHRRVAAMAVHTEVDAAGFHFCALFPARLFVA